ncbi:MAG: hypothetical protein GXW89_19555 [Phycisphaerae bacterium]|nr:hypothetical protein [Phycisphaerae bacterium]
MRSSSRILLVVVVWAFAGNNAALSADIHSLLLDAQKQFENARYDQALKLYQRANDAEPGHAAIEYNIALCHLYLGDGEKAAQQFESLASRGEVSRLLRRDAFYNVGLIRARAARERLRDLLAPATQPSDHKRAPDSPENIPELQSIAAGLLRAIAAFRESVELEPSDDAEHNIRAARITRRDVLGMLRKATEAKQKDDMLKDPRAYLETLILEQRQQASLGRLLALDPPVDAARVRAARRMGVRAQRKIMENTATFADHLAQFRERGDADTATAAGAQSHGAQSGAPSASQPAEETPREKVYHVAARQMEKAVEAQREACAFLLDGEIETAHEKQSAARDELYTALYLFPFDPGQVLVKARVEQEQLREVVGGIKAGEDWLRDPLLPEVTLPGEVQEEADKMPIYGDQARIGRVLSLLKRQCEHVAATSQPAAEGGQDAGSPGENAEAPEPMLDPELNRKLAEVLKDVEELDKKCLEGIVAKNQQATLAGQDELIKVIDAALELLPKTLEQRITELIVRQARLNAEVQGEAGRPSSASGGAVGAALDEIRNLATRFKSKLLGTKPAKLAATLSAKQQSIRTDTAEVQDEIRQKIPAGADAQASAGPAASQPAELKAYIEASKHLNEAGGHMDASVKGFEQAVVEDSLRPMQPGGPVQTRQAGALEELVKALAALKPPSTQPSEDNEDQTQRQQPQRQQQEQDQDRQRNVEKMEKERERAERELYQRRPRTVIKDW